jgi:hypothetical protein
MCFSTTLDSEPIILLRYIYVIWSVGKFRKLFSGKDLTDWTAGENRYIN